MDTICKKYAHIQVPFKVSPGIIYVSSAGYLIFGYDNYCQENTKNGPDKKIDVIVMPEPSTTSKADVWVIEAKDYRNITKRPNPSNAENLQQTLERKFADSHIRISSGGCPACVCDTYMSADNIHFCAHIEPPGKENTEPHIYGLLVSVIAHLMANCSSVSTPNGSPLQVFNTKGINADSRLPWVCQTTTP